MDAETLAVAVKLAKKKTLPPVTSEDEGSMLVVNENGEWSKGTPISSTLTVSGNTLVVTAAE